MRKIALLLVLCIGLLQTAIPVFAQEQSVSGTISSGVDQSPLGGVTILLKGTNRSTVSDQSGHFTITAKKGQVLQLTSVGFQPLEYTIGDGKTISLVMQQQQGQLGEVVVVGYGTQKKANLTGAVSTVKVDEVLGSRPITDVARGLQGSVAGVTISTPSGDLGTNPAIRLRGMTGSLNAPAGAQPLILVDNVELPNLNMINPEDIESISVLKDAASTSIYGTRAAWGVILITTKSGKRGTEKMSISYNNNFSWNKPTTTPEIAEAAAGAEMALLALKRKSPTTTSFGVVGMYIDEASIEKMKEWQRLYGGQNLGDEMVMGRDFEFRDNKLFFYRPWDPGKMYLREWTPQQTHNLTISGSNKKTGYNLNLGYLNQEGVLKANPDQFTRFNANLGINSSVTNWLDVRSKIILSRSNKTRPYYFSTETYDPWYYLYRWPAVYPYGTYEGKPFRSALTEVQQAKMSDFESDLTRVQLGGTLKLAKGLTVDADYTYANNNGRTHHTGGYINAYNFWAGGASLNYGPYTSSSYDRVIYVSDWDRRNVFKAYATYTKELGDHDFKLMAGTDVEDFQYWQQSSEKRSLLDPNFGELRLATGDQFASGRRGHWATQGYFSRLNYTFRNKLLLEINGRYDGSSSFPKNDRWAFFPSVSAGYRITDENFMEFAKPYLSTLKFRASYGTVGNQGLNALYNNLFLATLGSYNSNWLVGTNNMLTLSTPGLVSPSLSWERVTTLDFGADATLFRKLNVVFDWYRRTTSDMIVAGIPVPSTLGTGAPVRNFAELTTTGWELELNWNQKFNNGLTLGITGQLSDFTEKLTKYAAATKQVNGYYEGKTLGEIWGYETDRYFTANDFDKDANGNLLLQNGKYVMAKGIPTQERWESGWFFYGPGDIKYKDLNNDGKIDFGSNTVDDGGDLKVIGNSTPRYQYGIRLNADYKGIDFSLFVQGVGKRQMWADGPVFIPGYRPGEAWFQHQLDYWTPENPTAFYPRPTDQLSGGGVSKFANFQPQTKYLLNMAYTRLKNVTLGYTLPSAITRKAKLTNARVYVSGENLFELDNLNIPIDPEVNYTTSGLNDPNTFGRVYPYRRTVSVGVQVSL